MKLAAAILIIATSYFAGLVYKSRLTEREALLCEACELVRLFSAGIRLSRRPLSELVLSCEEMCPKLLSVCAERIKAGMDFHSAFELSINGLSINSDDKSALLSLGTSLGHSDIDGELELLSKYGEQFESSLTKLRAENSDKKKLCSAISLLSGVFVSIIVM